MLLRLHRQIVFNEAIVKRTCILCIEDDSCDMIQIRSSDHYQTSNTDVSRLENQFLLKEHVRLGGREWLVVRYGPSQYQGRCD